MSFFRRLYCITIGGTSDVSFDTPNGEVLLTADPIADLAAATKRYVQSGTLSVTTVLTSTYTILPTDTIVSCKYSNTGTLAITLPLVSAVSVGKTFHIIDADGNAYNNNITVSSTNTINGETSVLITQDYQSISIYSDGTAWFIY